MTATHSPELATISSAQVAAQAQPVRPSGRPADIWDILTMPFPWPEHVLSTSFGSLLDFVSLNVVHVPEDGHCQFAAVALIVYGDASFKSVQLIRLHLA